MKGAIQTHPEGQYFIEWWEGSSRRRKQVPERSEVLEHARRKSLALEAIRAGIPVVKGEPEGADRMTVKAAHPNGLVFPTSNGVPDKKHDNKPKKLDYRAGLNCGTCESKHGNKCSDGPYCSQWFLHKFRHTFATRNLQEHVCDIRTLQLWLGHSDLASTVVYLKGVRTKDVVDKVNRSPLAVYAVA
ncbi:MAG: tyrosine-type recombinase/integrase [Acidobacteriaceae bacterium]